MFEKKSLDPTPSAPVTDPAPSHQTVIGPGVHIQGDIQGRSDVELRGTVEGSVRLEGLLVVGDGGRITGDIRASAVVVKGEVKGDIDARDRVQLCSSAKMKGTLRASSLSIQEGALFEGRVSELPAHGESPERHHDVAPDYEEEPVYS